MSTDLGTSLSRCERAGVRVLCDSFPSSAAY